MPIDQREKLKENPFSYQTTKARKTMIYWKNQQIVILSEKETKGFLTKIEGKSELEIQLVLAKITGHFKHENER
ncbi:MAG: hypothetical protein H7X94_15000 [Vallitaleaceae bacterium]|nr:hypothetical protein [Vallitaleaceae bacterium]